MALHFESRAAPATLLEQAEALVTSVVDAYRQPDAYSRLPRFRVEQAAIDWGTVWGTNQPAEQHQSQQAPDVPFPVLLHRIERLARKVEVLQVLVAGFAEKAYSAASERTELFGMPPGKTAFRNVAEYLRDALKIPLRQAKSRVKLASDLAPEPSLDGGHMPVSDFPDVAEGFFATAFDTTAAQLVVDTVGQVQRAALDAQALDGQVQDRLVEGQQQLAQQATVLDPDGLRQVAKRWSQHTTYWFDQDGTREPAVLDRHRGAFYRGQARGLHQWTLRVDGLFHERLRVLASVVNQPNTNFRALKTLLEQLFGTSLPNFTTPTVAAQQPVADGQQELFSEDEAGAGLPDLDGRTREQKLLDGITAVFDTGLSMASATFPKVGGLPPQLSVIMDYQTLYDHLTQAAPGNRRSSVSAQDFVSQALFTGPIAPSTIRPLSCEADLIPAVLGSQGAVLDLGRTARLFTADQRRALIARDRGCAAPNCTIPAPWCDAHHVVAWQDGGSTTVANAVLLCSHHHHAVHAGLWEITVDGGVAWFTPAPYLAADRRPRRNRFWR